MVLTLCSRWLITGVTGVLFSRNGMGMIRVCVKTGCGENTQELLTVD